MVDVTYPLAWCHFDVWDRFNYMVNVSLSNIDNLERTWITLIWYFFKTLPLLVVSLLFVQLCNSGRSSLQSVPRVPRWTRMSFFHASLNGASQYNGSLYDGKTITLCYCQRAFPAHCYHSLIWIWILLLKGSKKDPFQCLHPHLRWASVQCPPFLCSEWKQQQY